MEFKFTQLFWLVIHLIGYFMDELFWLTTLLIQLLCLTLLIWGLIFFSPFCRITRPWWHSLNTSFDLEDSPYKGCGFIVRFELFLKHAYAYLFIGCSLRDICTVCCSQWWGPCKHYPLSYRRLQLTILQALQCLTSCKARLNLRYKTKIFWNTINTLLLGFFLFTFLLF